MAHHVNNVKNRVIKIESQNNFHKKPRLEKTQDMAATFQTTGSDLDTNQRGLSMNNTKD